MLFIVAGKRTCSDEFLTPCRKKVYRETFIPLPMEIPDPKIVFLQVICGQTGLGGYQFRGFEKRSSGLIHRIAIVGDRNNLIRLEGVYHLYLRCAWVTSDVYTLEVDSNRREWY